MNSPTSDKPQDLLTIAGRKFGSRLLVGTGKFASGQVMGKALEASGTPGAEALRKALAGP